MVLTYNQYYPFQAPFPAETNFMEDSYVNGEYGETYNPYGYADPNVYQGGYPVEGYEGEAIPMQGEYLDPYGSYQGEMYQGQYGGYPGEVFPGPGQGGGGFPGGGGGFPGQGGQVGPPGPPPSYTPQLTGASQFAVDPGGIRRCLYRYTYIWLRNGRSFWYFPTFVGRNSVAGYRWRRRTGWVYFGIDLRSINSFQCR